MNKIPIAIADSVDDLVADAKVFPNSINYALRLSRVLGYLEHDGYDISCYKKAYEEAKKLLLKNMELRYNGTRR